MSTDTRYILAALRAAGSYVRSRLKANRNKSKVTGTVHFLSEIEEARAVYVLDALEEASEGVRQLGRRDSTALVNVLDDYLRAYDEAQQAAKSTEEALARLTTGAADLLEVGKAARISLEAGRAAARALQVLRQERTAYHNSPVHLLTADMVHEAEAHVPFDYGRRQRWEFLAERLNYAMANPNAVCDCCGATASGDHSFS
ncbi:hypothetical protein [Microcystis phage Me-ZS1]|nr:hypothetical protein [Microcystis phage Me-ZS1]